MVTTMFKPRNVIYNALLLSAAMLGAAGCGQSAPPPGAPKSFSPASVDLGPEGSTKDAAADSSESKPADQPAPAQPGETK
jgi:hypothetical protein